MAAGSAAIFFSSRMSPAALTMHTLTVSRDTSRPAKYSIFLSLGCHTECQDSRLGSTARLLHLCRLGLDGDVPDHSTFSKNRHGRFGESDLLRKLFETVVARCMKEGLVGGEAFAVEPSLIVADAHRRRGVAKVEDLDPSSNRAVAEYLSVLDDAAFGGATPVEPKAISPTAPAAPLHSRGRQAGGLRLFRQRPHRSEARGDHGRRGDDGHSPGGSRSSQGDARPHGRTVRSRPSRLVADAGYGSAEMIGWLVDERGIE